MTRFLDYYGRRGRQPRAYWPGVATEGPSSVLLGASEAAVPEAASKAALPPASRASGRSSASAEAAAEPRAETADLRRRRKEAWFVYYHRAFSHRDADVRGLIRLKMANAVEPRGRRCPACGVAKAHRNHFGGLGREAPAAPLP